MKLKQENKIVESFLRLYGNMTKEQERAQLD